MLTSLISGEESGWLALREYLFILQITPTGSRNEDFDNSLAGQSSCTQSIHAPNERDWFHACSRKTELRGSDLKGN